MSPATRIRFCFPESAENAESFLDELVELAGSDEAIGYAGYLEKEYLRKELSWRYEDGEMKAYAKLSPEQQSDIEETISAAVAKAAEALPMPEGTKEMFVFVFPWLPPFDEHDRIMGYVTGFCPYAATLHVFLAPDRYEKDSLRQTVVHEYNHSVFFGTHQDLDPNSAHMVSTIKDVLVWEGLAENFVEEVLKEDPYVSGALSKQEADEALTALQPVLERKLSDNDGTYEQVFFGRGGTYKKWTGYAVGYHIVKAFRFAHPQHSWEEIINMKPADIFTQSGFQNVSN